MFNLTQELNRQANKICDDLIAAKRAAKENKGAKAAYHEGRAEELAKWLSSVEALLKKLTDERERRGKYEPKRKH